MAKGIDKDSKKRKTKLTNWSGGLHKSFRLLSSTKQSNADLLAFLNSPPGTHRSEVLARLPYEQSRSGSRTPRKGPDDKRYRDLKQVLETCGLIWEDDAGCIQFTEFGTALRNFMPHATRRNIVLVAQYAAFGLTACQLRNPTGAGRRYASSMEVFPFRFLWDAMLKLDNRIDSDELNRAIFRTTNAESLAEAITKIRSYRKNGNITDLGEEVLTDPKKNDRLIPMVSIAAFGWALINRKDESGYYKVKDECVRLLEAAVSLPVKHRQYDSVQSYVTAISNAACLPKDYR